MMFEVGDVVICVDDRACMCGCGDIAAIKKGRVYRIKKCWLWEEGDSFWAVTLEGASVMTPSHDEDGIGAERFRKIDSEVTEDFREMLRKIPAKDKQDARL